MINKIFIAALFFLSSFIAGAGADTIYLKNGRSIEGLIEKENDESVELNVGPGTVKFKRDAIENIYRSTIDEEACIRQEWQRQKKSEEKRRAMKKQKLEDEARQKELEPKEAKFSKAGDRIIVNALLNKKISASFLLDTGASAILLSGRIAKRLGIKPTDPKAETVQVQMADGSKTGGIYVVLDSVSVEGAEARDVGAVVLSDYSETAIQDGVLGMSFLNRFNCRIDTVNKKLILEKLRPEKKEK